MRILIYRQLATQCDFSVPKLNQLFQIELFIFVKHKMPPSHYLNPFTFLNCSLSMRVINSKRDQLSSLLII